MKEAHLEECNDVTVNSTLLNSLQETNTKPKTSGRVKSIWKTLCLRRNVLIMVLFFAFFNIMLQRVNLSVGIVAMNKNYTVTLSNGTTIYVRDVTWNSIERGHVLSAFYYGYVFIPLIGAAVINKFGGIKVLGTGIICTSFLTIITPFIARTDDVYWMIILRALVGVFEGASFPSIAAIRAPWIIPDDRCKMCSISYCGVPFGTFFTLIVCGMLAEKFGWPSIFYFTGFVGFIYAVVLFVFTRNNPKDDPWITKEELAYLEKSVGKIKRNVKIPWIKILTSAPVVANAIATFCESWGQTTLITQLPTFYNDVFQYSVKNSGIYSSLSFLSSPIALLLAAYLADKIIQNGKFTTTQVRKSFICIPFLIQAGITIIVSYSTNPILTSILTTMIGAFGSASLTTMHTNDLDLAPEHAGVIMGMGVLFYSLGAMLSPTYAGYITTHNSLTEWRIVFLTCGVMYVIGAIVFGIFGSGKRQKWGDRLQK